MFTLKIKVLDRFCKQRLSSGQVLSTYRIEIEGFDHQFLGLDEESGLQIPLFDLLIKSSILSKKLKNRKEEDPSTYDEWVIIDGLKLTVVNGHTILMKHGAMGAFQRQFDTVHNEAKLAKDMAELKDGEELMQYDDEANQVEKLLENEDFLGDDDMVDYGDQGPPVDGVNMVDNTISESNVPTLTEQKHVEFICKKMFGEGSSTIAPIKRLLQLKIPISLLPSAEQKQTCNQILKLYTIKDLFFHMRPDYVNVIGILKNV